MTPRGDRERPKIASRRPLRRSERVSFSMSKLVFDFGLFWVPFWSLLGRLWGAKLGPKSVKKSTSNCKIGLGPVLGRSWVVLGRPLGSKTLIFLMFFNDSLTEDAGRRGFSFSNQRGETQKHTQSVKQHHRQPAADRKGPFHFARVFP